MTHRIQAHEQLQKVYCRVDPEFTGNIFTRNADISNELTDLAVERLRHYGVDCVGLPISPRGGGHDTLWEFVKLLWEARDYLGIVVGVARTILRGVVNIGRHQIKSASAGTRPTYIISLTIKTSVDADHQWLSKRSSLHLSTSAMS